MDYTGPAGDEARALLREIRSLAFLQTHSRGSRGSPYVARSSVTGVSAHSPRVSSPVVNRAAAGATQRQNRLAAARADSDQSHTDFSMDQESSHDV